MSSDAENLELEDLIGGQTQDQAEIDKMIARLEAMQGADIRNCFDEKGKELPIHQWPDAEATALVRLSYNMHGPTIHFADRSKINEQIIKLKGLGRPEDEASNPFEEILKRIPRKDLVLIVNALRHLGDLENKNGV